MPTADAMAGGTAWRASHCSRSEGLVGRACMRNGRYSGRRPVSITLSTAASPRSKPWVLLVTALIKSIGDWPACWYMLVSWHCWRPKLGRRGPFTQYELKASVKAAKVWRDASGSVWYQIFASPPSAKCTEPAFLAFCHYSSSRLQRR